MGKTKTSNCLQHKHQQYSTRLVSCMAPYCSVVWFFNWELTQKLHMGGQPQKSFRRCIVKKGHLLLPLMCKNKVKICVFNYPTFKNVCEVPFKSKHPKDTRWKTQAKSDTTWQNMHRNWISLLHTESNPQGYKND